MAIKSAKYVGDFETTTDPNDVRVWAVCLVDIDTNETALVENDISAMFDFLKKQNSDVYFHNLKFDGEFILSWLLTNGFQYSETGEPGTFKTLITDEGIFYSITVYFEKKNKKYKKVTFYDSLKKLPFKVSVISKAFELKDEKLVIDYKAHRPVGHVLTDQERQYVINDCKIVAQALKIQFDKGLAKMTNASDAMNGYKDIINKGRFEQWFPTLSIEVDANIRLAYKGGFTYLSPRYKNKRIKSGIVFDQNSMYPATMYDKMLPYGYPTFFEGKYRHDPAFPLFIQHLYCTFQLKKDHIPTIQLKNTRRFIETEYLINTIDGMGLDEPVHLYLTTPDLELFLDHYDVDFDHSYDGSENGWIDGWKFKGAVGMFKEYIDYWMHIKETTTGAMRQLAKLMLNSLYGKFATNPIGFKKRPRIDEFGIVRYDLLNEKYCKEHGLPPPEVRDPVYTAMGCFITAYSREKTIRSAQRVFNRFIYADTDSLHLEGTELPEGLDIHPTRLGAWKHEGTFVDSKYIRAKTYMETIEEYKKRDTLNEYAKLLNSSFDVFRENGAIRYYDTKVTCAGMPDNVKESVTYDNFHSGSVFQGKLYQKRYKGGIILEEGPFTIK